MQCLDWDRACLTLPWLVVVLQASHQSLIAESNSDMYRSFFVAKYIATVAVCIVQDIG